LTAICLECEPFYRTICYFCRHKIFIY